jgi:tetratricopeptide (TPR) repeat protein
MSTYTGMLLYANYSASSSQAEIKSWQESMIIPDEKNWQEAFDSNQVAIKFDPNNPEYLGYEAQLYRYKAIMPDTRPSKAIAAYREALAKYQYLLTLRPSWAPYWSSIISIKYELWEYDELMITALNNAARLAPWFKSNQHIILRAGFHGWSLIDDETRKVIDQTLERAMQLQPKLTIRLALEHGFADRVEPYVEGDEVLQGFYEKELKRMKKEGQR